MLLLSPKCKGPHQWISKSNIHQLQDGIVNTSMIVQHIWSSYKNKTWCGRNSTYKLSVKHNVPLSVLNKRVLSSSFACESTIFSKVWFCSKMIYTKPMPNNDANEISSHHPLWSWPMNLKIYVFTFRKHIPKNNFDLWSLTLKVDRIHYHSVGYMCEMFVQLLVYT